MFLRKQYKREILDESMLRENTIQTPLQKLNYFWKIDFVIFWLIKFIDICGRNIANRLINKSPNNCVSKP